MSRAAGAEAQETPLHSSPGPEETKQKEHLAIMMKLADARLATFENELRTMLLDPDSAMKTSVTGKKALRFERHYLVDVEPEVCRAFVCKLARCSLHIRTAKGLRMRWTTFLAHTMARKPYSPGSRVSSKAGLPPSCRTPHPAKAQTNASSLASNSAYTHQSRTLRVQHDRANRYSQQKRHHPHRHVLLEVQFRQHGHSRWCVQEHHGVRPLCLRGRP